MDNERTRDEGIREKGQKKSIKQLEQLNKYLQDDSKNNEERKKFQNEKSKKQVKQLIDYFLYS